MKEWEGIIWLFEIKLYYCDGDGSYTDILVLCGLKPCNSYTTWFQLRAHTLFWRARDLIFCHSYSKLDLYLTGVSHGALIRVLRSLIGLILGLTQQRHPKVHRIFLQKKYSLQMALTSGICQEDLVLGQGEDQIRWLWSNNKEYSANLLYKLVVVVGKTTWEYKFIWCLKTPYCSCLCLSTFTR